MRKGFTLIETLVAISVLLISLAGPLSLAAQALKSAYYARDEITAFYLAQEGIEYARAVRDQNYLHNSPQSWLTGLADCLSPAVCQVDFPHFSHAVCPDGVCAPLLLDTSTGLFQEESNTHTERSIFTRSLTLVPVTNNPAGCSGEACKEVAVTVQVVWTSAGINRTFKLSEHLFDWLPSTP